MNENSNFYKWFNDVSFKLGAREISFKKIFKYLDSQPTPIIIVETGCLRTKDNFSDGQSTLLFDKYTLWRGENSKVYFIADIAANHDGSLFRAKKLIRLCAKAGANAAKFQHFKAETIVLDNGFKKVGKITHQAKWKKSVFDVYKDASINPKWTAALKKECKKNNIDFLTAPYDLDYVDSVNKYISAYKIGSGDITWKEIIIKIAKKKKPVLLACGASTLKETVDATNLILKHNKRLVLMQCNTNYTGSIENFSYINLNVPALLIKSKEVL